MKVYPQLKYPPPLPDLAARMADALASLSNDSLDSVLDRLDQYAVTLSVNDILSLRGATFKKLDQAARAHEIERRAS